MTNEEIYQYHKGLEDERERKRSLLKKNFEEIKYLTDYREPPGKYCAAIMDSIRSLCELGIERIERGY